MKNAVVITPAEKLNYHHNYVALPYDYGRPSYFNRADIKAIRRAVFESLETLDELTGFKARFKDHKVLVKPNLVGVMRSAVYCCGYDIPQTTDPRVFEAVIAFLKDLNMQITIGEGSGSNTRSSFRETGYDRISRYYGTELVCFEEQPLDHYYVPKAEVQKEVFLPRIISNVVRGEMLYVSVPKIKTNLYTQVTLGFKNAMGTLPFNMRYRNHTWQINKKLTDLLFLFKPDLTVVDGIIGGEGLTPGPVDPVEFDTIITGTNSVEVDRVVTRMMGFDPDKNELMIEAVKKGFGDPEVVVVGDPKVIPFRPADASLLSERFIKNWPNVRLFVGHNNSRAPKITDIHAVSPEMVRQNEQTCVGGCLSTLGMCMEMYLKAKKDMTDLRFAFVLGGGVEFEGKKYWFDYEGKPYDLEALKAQPMKKLCVGECSKPAAAACDVVANGCGNVNELNAKIMSATGKLMPMLSIDNEGLPSMLTSLVETYFIKRKLVKQGEIVDIPADATSDRIFEIPELSAEEKQKDWIFVHRQITPEQIKENLKEIKIIPL